VKHVQCSLKHMARSREEIKCFRVAYTFQRDSTKIRILKEAVIQKLSVLMKMLTKYGILLFRQGKTLIRPIIQKY